VLCLSPQESTNTLESSVRDLLQELFKLYSSNNITRKQLKLLIAGLIVAGDEKLEELESAIESDSDLRRVAVIMENFSKGR